LTSLTTCDIIISMHRKIHRLFKIKDEMQPVEKIFLEHIQNKDELNPPQQKIANNLYHKYFEGDWMSSYGPKKRRIARSCAQYWVNNPPKYSELAAKILNDSDYIPSRDEYKQICECKEARNFLHPEEAEPLYPAGTLVKVSPGAAAYKKVLIGGGHHDFRGKLGVVIKIQKDERVFPSNPGVFLYYVLPQGKTEMLLFNEKDLTHVETNK